MKKIISLFLAACVGAGVCAASGCNSPKTEENAGSALPVISSFETLDEIYARMSFENRFGKVRLNEDKKYVTDGERSLKLEVHGDYVAGGTPVLMRVSFAGLEQEGVPYIDLSKLESVQMDLFNETGSAQKIEVALVIGGVTTDYVAAEAATGKNAAFTVAYDVKGLSVGADMTKAEELIIKFPKSESMEEGANVFYMDNLRFTFLAKAPAPIEIVLDENEFCSFDKSYQKYVVQPGGVGPTEGCQPQLSINTDLKYCKDTRGNSLKVVLPRGSEPIGDGWPYFAFIDKLVKSFDYVDLMNKGAVFAFDVYNEGSAYNFGLEVWTNISGLSGGYAFTAYNGWTEVRVPLKDLMSKSVGDATVAANVSKILISYGKFDAPDKTFYFDDFRFEFSA